MFPFWDGTILRGENSACLLWAPTRQSVERRGFPRASYSSSPIEQEELAGGARGVVGSSTPPSHWWSKAESTRMRTVRVKTREERERSQSAKRGRYEGVPNCRMGPPQLRYNDHTKQRRNAVTAPKRSPQRRRAHHTLVCNARRRSIVLTALSSSSRWRSLPPGRSPLPCRRRQPTTRAGARLLGPACCCAPCPLLPAAQRLFCLRQLFSSPCLPESLLLLSLRPPFLPEA